MTDEYGELYNGYRFTAYKHGLGHSVVLDYDMEMAIPQEYKNPSKFAVWCHNCCCYMIFHEGEEYMEGHWQCPECGKTVKEITAYHRIDRDIDLDDERERREQERWATENDNDWD